MKLQKIGSILFLPAFILSVLAAWNMSELISYFAWAVYAAIGSIDVYLALTHQQVITNYWRSLFPKKVDLIIMLGFIALVWYLVGPIFAVFYFGGFLNNHLNEDRK